jgi:hypothetical protein
MREQRRTTRAERSGRAFGAAVAGRGEAASSTDRQRDEVTHGAAATCITRGADVAAGRQRRREVAAAPCSCHARTTPASGRRLSGA